MSFGEKNVKRGKRTGQNVREKEKVKGKMKLKGVTKMLTGQKLKAERRERNKYWHFTARGKKKIFFRMGGKGGQGFPDRYIGPSHLPIIEGSGQNTNYRRLNKPTCMPLGFWDSGALLNRSSS